MAGSQSSGDRSENPVAVNVTAMVDVIFCLCVFFICSLRFQRLDGTLETALPKHAGDDAGVVLFRPEEIRVLLRWDPAARQTIRHFAGYEPAESDADLMGRVATIAGGLESAGSEALPLVIDSAPDVPWQSVIHVLDLAKQRKIERVELAAGGPG